MKDNEKVILTLNQAARAELQAICQYKTHALLQKAAGYSKISKRITREHMGDEERHQCLFMERIIDLEGVPDISHMPELKIGSLISDQFENDLTAEYSAIEQYRDAAVDEWGADAIVADRQVDIAVAVEISSDDLGGLIADGNRRAGGERARAKGGRAGDKVVGKDFNRAA